MDNMIIGTWAQPAFQIDGSNLIDLSKKWADRGVTHFITGDPEPRWNGNTIDRYANWLKDHSGLKWMAYARKGFETYVKYDNFAGYVMPDEPDLDNHLLVLPDGSFAADLSIQYYLSCTDQIRSRVPNYPIFGNFSGPTFTSSRVTPTPTQQLSQAHYAKWFTGLDITSCDWYLATTGRNVASYIKVTLGEQITRMMNLSGGKPAFACIECSNQGLQNNSREPTTTEFAAMIMISLIRGAKGIWYFPQKVGGGFAYDNMSQAMSDYMTSFNKMLLSYSDFFMKGVRTVVNTPTYESATWILDNRKLVITLNCTNDVQTIDGKLYQPLEYSAVDSILTPPGLIGSYFSDINLTTKIVDRIDPQINLAAVASQLPSGINPQQFSVTWQGYLVPTETGDHTIYTQTDDGVRLYIDGKKVVDKWARYRGENSVTVPLQSGVKYPIRMDYFQQWNDGYAKLLWQTPNGTKALIPSGCLSSLQ
jgi:hypothetical protein